MTEKSRSRRSGSTRRPDFASFAGLVLAVGGILGGLLLEGGKIQDVSQVTAALIVLGGTIGAVLVTTPPGILGRALKRLPGIFVEQIDDPQVLVEELIRYATKARREGVVALEREADAIADPFLRKALNLAIDGNDLQQIRKMLELEIALLEQRGEAEAKVYECAGGYAPTIGIIGAVLGLIQVMKNLSNIDEVGRGIAVAFVATVYGVGSANIFFLPAANKLRSRVHQAAQMRELVLEGVAGIVEGLNPLLIRLRLEGYTGPSVQSRSPEKAGPEGLAKSAS